MIITVKPTTCFDLYASGYNIHFDIIEGNLLYNIFQLRNNYDVVCYVFIEDEQAGINVSMHY